MEEFMEVIIVVEFYLIYCNFFMYLSLKGIIKLVDMRDLVLCD